MDVTYQCFPGPDILTDSQLLLLVILNFFTIALIQARSCDVPPASNGCVGLVVQRVNIYKDDLKFNFGSFSNKRQAPRLRRRRAASKVLKL